MLKLVQQEATFPSLLCSQVRYVQIRVEGAREDERKGWGGICVTSTLGTNYSRGPFTGAGAACSSSPVWILWVRRTDEEATQRLAKQQGPGAGPLKDTCSTAAPPAAPRARLQNREDLLSYRGCATGGLPCCDCLALSTTN